MIIDIGRELSSAVAFGVDSGGAHSSPTNNLVVMTIIMMMMLMLMMTMVSLCFESWMKISGHHHQQVGFLQGNPFHKVKIN